MEIDFSHQTRLYLGLYEIEMNCVLRRLARNIGLAWDVGGHVGYQALVMAKLSGGKVVSFERDGRLAEAMERNFASNPTLAPLLKGVHTCVGESSEGNTIALDDFDRTKESPQLIKIDVEGAELSVLRGATRLLRDARPALLVETHSETLERACGRLIADAGYRVRVVNQRRWLPDYRPTPHNRWLVGEPV